MHLDEGKIKTCKYIISYHHNFWKANTKADSYNFKQIVIKQIIFDYNIYKLGFNTKQAYWLWLNSSEKYVGSG